MVICELASYLLSFKGLTSMHMQYNIMYLDIVSDKCLFQYCDVDPRLIFQKQSYVGNSAVAKYLTRYPSQPVHDS